MMFKKGIFTLIIIFMAAAMASCGNINQRREYRASGGQAVSGQAVNGQTVSGQTVNGQSAEGAEEIKPADPKTGDRIDFTVEPAINPEKQIDVIVSQKDIWNMGDPADKRTSEAFYISDFDYALTDLDQDGYIEILVYCTQGTGQFTSLSVYEVNESGNGLVKWDIKEDPSFEEEGVSPDFYEYPAEACFDRNTGRYHYTSLDHVHDSASAGANYLVDMEAVDNTIQMHVVTYEKHGRDGKCVNGGNDPDDYYKEMSKRYMFYRTFHIKSEKLEKAEAETIDELTWNLEDSWYSFSIAETDHDAAFEASLSDDIRGQLETLASSETGLEQYFDYEDLSVDYAVTDFDRDGKLELTAATIGGTGRYCHYSMYEVDGTGKDVVKWKCNTPEGESLADICSADEVATYTDEASGVIYYLFEDFLHISGEESYQIPKTVFVRKNVVHESGKPAKDKRQKMKEGKQAFGWRHATGYDLSRMHGSGFMYDELVASWKVFCGG